MNNASAIAGRLAKFVFFLAITACVIIGQSGSVRAGPAPDLTLALSYTPSTIAQGGTTVATYTISNTTTSSTADDIAFTDTLTAGLEIAASPDAVTTCSGRTVPPTLTAPGGGGTISFSGGSLAAGANCTITVNIKGVTAGSHTNFTDTLTSSLGPANMANATLTVDAARPLFSKTISPTSVSLNGTSTMTYTIDNTPYGGVITGVGFSETLPTGVQIASPSNLATTCTNGILTAAAGSSSISLSGAYFTSATSCTITVDVQGTISGDYTLTSGELNSSLGSLGVASASLTVETPSTSAPTLTKTFSGDPVAPGGTVTLGFNLYNPNNDFAATNIAFTDDLNAMLTGATLVSNVTDPCGSGSSISGAGTGTISFTSGSLASRANCSFNVTVRIPSTATGDTYTNTTSTVSATVNGSTVTSASGASDTLQVTDQAPLDLAMSWASVDAGDPTTVTFTVTNPNASQTATGIAFSLTKAAPFPNAPIATLPPSTNTCGGTMATNSYSYSTTTIVTSYDYSGGTLAGGSSCIIAFDIEVPSGTSSGIYPQETGAITATINTASTSGDAASANLSVSVSTSPLSISKSFDQSSAGAGDSVGMTLSLSNNSETSNATNISFTDDLDTFHSGATLASVESNGCSGTVSGVGTGSLGYSGGSVSTGASCDIKVSVTLGTATGGQTNTTSDLTASLGGGSATVQNNSAASASITVNTSSPLTASLEIIDDPVVAGGTVTARYTISNPTSGSAATGITFTQSFSSALSSLAATTPLPANPCGSGSALSGTTTLFMSGGNIVPDDNCTFDVILTVPGGASNGSYTLSSSGISFTSDGTSKSIDPISDSLIVGVTNEGSNALQLSKSFDSSYVQAGGSVGLTLTLENVGTEDATAVAFTDNLTSFLSGTNFVNVTSNTCGGTLTGEIGTLLSLSNVALTAGSSCTLKIPVAFSAGVALGTYTNTTSAVSGTTASGAVGGPADTASIEVRSASVPTFTKSISPSTANANSTVTFRYSIFNPTGGVARSGLAFTDNVTTAIPGATATVLPGAGACGTGSTVTGSGLIALSGGNLAAGASCIFDVTVTVPTPAAATYTSTTSTLSDNGIILAAGASDTLTVNPLPPSFSKVFAPDSMVQGDTSTLTFTINATSSTALVPGLSFTDNLPSGVVLASTPNGSSTCTGGTLTAASGAGTISYSGGTVPAGSTCTVSVDVTSVSIGAYVNTSGALSSDFGSGGTASDTLSVTTAPTPGFTAAFSPSAIAEGATSTLTFTINNTGALIPATALAFSDNLPASITVATVPNASTTCTGGTLTAA
ncbi:conserved repeat domain-containing protein, partial [Thalassovita gelatinovora]